MDELSATVRRAARPRARARSRGFSPRVDVYYCGERPAAGAIVKAELAGVDDRRGRPRGLGPRAGDHRRAAGAGDRGPRLPAGRDRGRPVPPGGRARRRRRRRARPRHLRGRRPAGRAAASPARRARRVPIDRATEAPVAPTRSRSSRRADVDEAVRERGGQPLPAALPVLPLRDMVTYPDTLTPLAVGQERSIKLINDVLSGERTLRHGRLHGSGARGARPRSAPRRRRRRRRRADAEGSRRDDPDPRPGHRAGAPRRLRRRPSPTWWRGSRRCPTWSSRRPSSRR